MDGIKDFDTSIAEITSEYLKLFGLAKDEGELRNARVKLVSKKSDFTKLLYSLGYAPAGSRKEYGEKINVLRRDIELAFETKLAEVKV